MDSVISYIAIAFRISQNISGPYFAILVGPQEQEATANATFMLTGECVDRQEKDMIDGKLRSRLMDSIII